MNQSGDSGPLFGTYRVTLLGDAGQVVDVVDTGPPLIQGVTALETQSASIVRCALPFTVVMDEGQRFARLVVTQSNVFEPEGLNYLMTRGEVAGAMAAQGGLVLEPGPTPAAP